MLWDNPIIEWPSSSHSKKTEGGTCESPSRKTGQSTTTEPHSEAWSSVSALVEDYLPEMGGLLVKAMR